MKVVTRKQALADGLIKYFTGKPCPNGHISERFVSTYSCVVCVDEHKKRYRKDPEFRERELQYKAKYREENRDKVNAYARWYWRNHPNAKSVDRRTKEKNKAYQVSYNADYWQKNKKRLSERFKKYSRENKDYFRAKCAERRALKMAGGSHTKEDIEEIMSMQGGKCAYCKSGISKKYHVDHIIPLSKGGSNQRSNLQCLCPSCNMRKSAKDPVDWAQEIGLLI